MLARIGAAENVRVVVDAAGPPLEAALAEGVFLIKPSRDELAAIVGTDRALRPEEQLAAANAIVGDGRAEIVALTLGAAGALLVSSAGALRLPTPDVRSRARSAPEMRSSAPSSYALPKVDLSRAPSERPSPQAAQPQ